MCLPRCFSHLEVWPSACPGDIPPSPARIDAESELPPAGSVKEMRALFEQRCGTPSRAESRRPATEGELSFPTHPPLFGQRSPVSDRPVTEQRLQDVPQAA